jgi:hypothetical protein
MLDYFRGVLRRSGEEKTEAWEGDEPALEIDGGWLQKLIQPYLCADAGALEEHGERADDAAVADILAGVAKAFGGEGWEEFEIGAEAI